ncbi:TBC-domain-containing protein [Gigaspora margarita]|uniref:TBC-domain-containing protein n=1 Tax=Gigaspora margarita TaxID=4874 RepID=A0A8H3XJX1_GIGMA|nr:TBC-domain-containing protein [Gigaspora margarita]
MSSQKFSKLEKLHQFAAKGGIGTCVAIEDTLANSQIDLMFYTGEVITVLKQIDDDIYLGFCEGVIGRFKGKSVSFNGPLKTQLTSNSDNNPTRKKSDGLFPDNSQRQFQQGSYLQPSNVGQNIQTNVGQNIQTRSRSSSMSSVDIISEPSSPPITPSISITYSNEDNQNYEGKKGSFNNHDNNFSTPVTKNLVQSHVPQSNINNPSSIQNKSVSSRSPEIKSNPHNMNQMVNSREYAINPSVRQITTPTPPLSSPNVSPSSRQISTPTPPLSSPNVSPSSRQISTPTPPLSSNVSPSSRQIHTPTPPLSSPNVSPSSRQISTPTPPLSSPNVYPSNPYIQSNSPSPSQKIIPYNPSSRQFSSPTPPLSSPKPDPSNPSSYRQFSSPTPPLSSQKPDPSNPSSYRQFSSPTPPLSSQKPVPSNPSSYRQFSSPTPPSSSQKPDPSNPSNPSSYRQFSSPTPPPSSPKIIPSNPSSRQFSSPTPPPSSPKIIPSNPSSRQFTTPNSPLSSPRSVPSSPLFSKIASNSPLSSPTSRQLSSPTSSLSSPKVVPQILVDDSELENRHKRFLSKKNYPTNDFDDDDSLYNSNNSSIDLPSRPMASFMYENGNDSGTNDSEDISSEEDEYDVKSLKNIEPKKKPDSPKKEKVIAVDNYGFVHKVAENEIPEGANGIQRIVHVPGVEEKTARSIRLYRDRETKWVAFLGSMDPSMARDSRKIKKLVRLGIPESVRGKAWQFMAGVHKYRKKGVFDKLRNKEKLPIYDDIEKDIDRCYPDHIHFREKGFGQEDLFNILKAYAHYDTVVGYCQGMGRLVGMMLMHIPAEDTFWLLVATIEEYMSGYFSPDLPQIKVDSRIFDLLLLEHNPKLAQHFRNEGVDPILYIPKWFLTIFTMVLPWSSVLRIWDVFYFEGVKLFFRIGLAILDCTRDYILNHCPTISEILEFLGSIPHELLTPDLLLDAAFKIKLKRSTIKRLTKKASDKNESDKKLKIDGIEFKLIGDVNKN